LKKEDREETEQLKRIDESIEEKDKIE
jgi:hypothetical protein